MAIADLPGSRNGVVDVDELVAAERRINTIPGIIRKEDRASTYQPLDGRIENEIGDISGRIECNDAFIVKATFDRQGRAIAQGEHSGIGNGRGPAIQNVTPRSRLNFATIRRLENAADQCCALQIDPRSIPGGGQNTVTGAVDHS